MRDLIDRKPKLMKAPTPIQDLLEELACLKKQTIEFFVKERGLKGSSCNLKVSADMACVTSNKIQEVRGKRTSFKTTHMT